MENIYIFYINIIGLWALKIKIILNRTWALFWDQTIIGGPPAVLPQILFWRPLASTYSIFFFSFSFFLQSSQWGNQRPRSWVRFSRQAYSWGSSSGPAPHQGYRGARGLRCSRSASFAFNLKHAYIPECERASTWHLISIYVSERSS